MSDKSASKKYVANAGWFLIEKLCRIVSGILVGVLVARFLGPEQFGIINYALNLMSIFTVLFYLGLDPIVIKELIKDDSSHPRILGTSFWLRFVGSVCTVLSVTLYSYFSDGPENSYIVFLVSISVLFQGFTVIDFFFQSASLAKYSAITQVITLSISSCVKIYLIFSGAALELFALMSALEAFIIMLCQLWFYANLGKKIKEWRFSFQEARLLLSDSWPIIVYGLIMILYQKMDQVLIKKFLDLNSLGNYAAASRISEAAFFIPTSLCAAIFPGILNNRNNRELQLKRLTQLYSLMLWLALFCSVSGFLVGDYVITFLFKEKYASAPGLFKILIWNLVPVFYTTAWGVWMVAENKQRFLIFFHASLLAIAITLNLTLIPAFGAKGAAYAFMITQFSSILISLTIYNPIASWRVFFEAMNPKNLFEVLRYVRGKD